MNQTTEQQSFQPSFGTEFESSDIPKEKPVPIDEDVPCPKCRSRKGSVVRTTIPQYTGRWRKRVCLACGHQFESMETYQKYEHSDTAPAKVRG